MYAPPGFVPRVVRSVSEALPGAARVDDDYMDAMRIRKRVHERSPDGVEVDATSGQDKRYRRSSPLLSPRSLKILQDWVSTHPDFPFPTDPEKLQLSRDTGLDVQQIELWFTTNRERISAANFAVQNGAPGLSPSVRRGLVGGGVCVVAMVDSLAPCHSAPSAAWAIDPIARQPHVPAAHVQRQ